MKNIHINPTDNPSKIYKENDELFFEEYPDRKVNAGNQYIYITNDDIVKEGDWLKRPSGIVSKHKKTERPPDDWDKIVLTTDPKLIADGIPDIDDEFLKWLVEHPNCESVEVTKELWTLNPDVDYFYRIIIPTEEPKQEIVGYRLKPSIDRLMVDSILKNAMPIWNDEDKSVYFIRGHVGGSLVAKMKELQVLDLWFTPIYESEEVKSDWVKEHHLDFYHKEGIMSNKSKQETLEEAAERYADYNNDYVPMTFGDKFNETTKRDFIAGAKWQQERMYSEKEVESLLHKFMQHKHPDWHGWSTTKWFEQFKKNKHN